LYKGSKSDIRKYTKITLWNKKQSFWRFRLVAFSFERVHRASVEAQKSFLICSERSGFKDWGSKITFESFRHIPQDLDVLQNQVVSISDHHGFGLQQLKNSCYGLS
jgi:hypothetical protein